jgi:uncharacterized protein
MPDEVVMWRKLDQPGHEAARLIFHDPFWQLGGTAVFAHESQPCRLEYLVACSSAWHTLHAKIAGWIGTRYVRIDLSADSNHRWRLNGRECPQVRGCIDLDLAFSPATNMFPIRRLGLAIGEKAEVRAAWLRFPELTLAALAQTYQRVDREKYRYEAFDGAFTAELEVNAAGLVIRYPDLWEAEPARGGPGG